MTSQAPVAVASPAPVTTTGMGILMDPDRFAHVQRVAQMMANSALFPEHLRKGGEKQAVANAVLVFDMAFRMNENPLTVAQNIYFVGGKPGWMTTYMIARANQSGVFTDQIEWEVKGKGEDLSVTAFATLAKSGRRAEVMVDMAMAKAEGWTSNKKYQTMPERMLRWRSATALIRLYAPEVMIGMPSQIELETGDIRDITPRETAEAAAPGPVEDAPDPGPMVEDAEEVAEETFESKPKPDPKPAPEPEPEKAQEDSAKNTTAPGPDEERFTHLAESILRDIEDVAADNVDEVLSLYEVQIDQLAAAFPDLHRKVMEAAEAKKKGGDA